MCRDRLRARASRAGFSLVEVAIVVVLGSVVLTSAIGVLVTNQRAHLAISAKVQGQQTLRAGIEVLFGELREISAAEGDLVNMGSDSVTVRSVRAFGLICDVTYGTPALKVKRVGSWFAAGDSVLVLADNDPDEPADDVWKVESVTAIDTLQTCSDGSPAQTLELGAMTLGAPPDSISPGTPVRSFLRHTYSLYSYLGDSYLGLREGSGTPEAVVGPLSANGLSFEYLDANGATTATAADVAEIQVTLRTQSQAIVQGSVVSDSIVVRISTRN